MDHPTIHILIAGNCDERGSESYNIALGQRRAESAKRFLTAYGVAQDRIETVSYGKDRLAFLGCTDEDCRSKNRRDEFSVKGSLSISQNVDGE
jgi:peptidoglycan-associated lipoprotein